MRREAAPAPVPPTATPPRGAAAPRRTATSTAAPSRAAAATGTDGGAPAIAGASAAAPSDAPPLITAPRFRRPPRPPEYPPRAVELDLTGTVVVRALLDPEGDPREIRIHRSSGHAILDGAAVAAVRGWHFAPAARDGQRIAAWVEVPVHFRLR